LTAEFNIVRIGIPVRNGSRNPGGHLSGKARVTDRMLLKSVEFSLMTFGLTMLIALFVAGLVKCIAIVVQRGKSSTPGNKPYN